MKYVRGYNPIKEHGITGKEMLVAALSEKTGKSEKELKKFPKIELRKMWDSLEADRELQENEAKTMREYTFEELGYFDENQCKAIKEELQGYSYMHFDIGWCNYAGNCTLVVRTDYDGEPKEIKNFFLHCALGKIFDLKRKA